MSSATGKKKKMMFLKARTNGVAADVEVEVHPVVLFTILDHFARRSTGEGERVIGTLLGERGNGVVKITNCYPVVHAEKLNPGSARLKVEVDDEMNAKFYRLHKRVNPTEEIVGWYGTTYKNGKVVTQESLVIHDHYLAPFSDVEGAEKVFVPNCVHLAVNAYATGTGKVDAKAFVANKISLNDGQMGVKFKELDLKVTASKDEKVGLRLMSKDLESSSKVTNIDPSKSYLENLKNGMKDLLAQLEKTCAYVENVVEGKESRDNEVGLQIARAVKSIPRIDPRELKAMFECGTQDLLMIAYLSQLAKAQVAITEKLSKMNP